MIINSARLHLAHHSVDAARLPDALSWSELNDETKDMHGEQSSLPATSPHAICKVYVSTIGLDVPAPLAPALSLLETLPIIGAMVKHYMVILEVQGPEAGNGGEEKGDEERGKGRPHQLVLCDFEPLDKTSPVTTIKLLTAGKMRPCTAPALAPPQGFAWSMVMVYDFGRQSGLIFYVREDRSSGWAIAPTSPGVSASQCSPSGHRSVLPLACVPSPMA